MPSRCTTLGPMTSCSSAQTLRGTAHIWLYSATELDAYVFGGCLVNGLEPAPKAGDFALERGLFLGETGDLALVRRLKSLLLARRFVHGGGDLRAQLLEARPQRALLGGQVGDAPLVEPPGLALLVLGAGGGGGDRA